MKILIVGGGIGGLTLAGFLKDSSIEFEIIEKATNWNTQGFSLGIWNNGRNILEKLGIADIFDKEGNRIRYYKICDGKGKLLRLYNLSEFYSAYGLAYSHIERYILHTMLLDRAGRERITLGVEVQSLSESGAGVQVTFNNGETKIYDFVVGADGIHSQVRNLFFNNNSEHFDNWRVWYAWVDNSFKQQATVTEYVEAGEFIGVFDVGHRTLVVLITPARHAIWDDVTGRLNRLKEIFKDETHLAGFLNNLKEEEIIPTDLSHVEMKKWFKGRVILVGDAAHGFEPHAGLGASMAMEDGYVLAGELMKISSTYTYDQAFANYQKTRQKRVKIAHSLTNRMRAWAFIKSKLWRKIVNILIPLIPQSFFTKKYHQLLKEEI